MLFLVFLQSEQIQPMSLRSLLNDIFGLKTMFSLRYFRQRRRWPDFDNPKDYSEINISQLLSEDFVRYSDYADKIKVRDYVKSKGLENILLKHYAYFSSTEEIVPEELPDRFVLKTNRGASGKDICICTDKKTFDWEAAFRKLKRAMTRRFEYERHYNVIEPRIICEELIETENGKYPIDYKFTCIRGQIVDVFLCSDREVGKPSHCTVDLDWNILPYTKEKYLPDTIPARPEHLDEMVRIAGILSEDFDLVRVDLYEYRNQVYFSELTFSPHGGIMYSYNDTGIKAIGEKYHEICAR